MQTSKVIITPDTLALNNVSPKRKSVLRRQAIIDLIKSKPNGTFIHKREFVRVGMFRSRFVADNFLNKMVDDGVLSREKLGPHRQSKMVYYVNDATTVQPKQLIDQEVDKPVPPPEVHQSTAFRSVQEYAKDYYWETNSNDLHEFVVWLDKLELEMRRGNK